MFFGLEDIKRMLQKKKCLDNVDSTLSHVESFLVLDWTIGDLTNPLEYPTNLLVDSSQDLTIISSDQD